MDRVQATHGRLEIKYLFDSVRELDFLGWLLHSGHEQVEQYPQRWVNSLYFDDHGYSSFVDNVAGIGTRAKVRYRWYGPMEASAAGALEVKLKKSHLGFKRIYDLPSSPLLPGRSWTEIRRNMENQLPQDGRLWLHSKPYPVLVNRYRRQYLASRDGRIRMTVDRDLSAWDQRWESRFNLRRSVRRPGVCIVELKLDPADRGRAGRLLKTIPARYRRSSKYVSLLDLLRLESP
jgi:hypothetical protein